jgi:hypothetical protein
VRRTVATGYAAKQVQGEDDATEFGEQSGVHQVIPA